MVLQLLAKWGQTVKDQGHDHTKYIRKAETYASMHQQLGVEFYVDILAFLLWKHCENRQFFDNIARINVKSYTVQTKIEAECRRL